MTNANDMQWLTRRAEMETHFRALALKAARRANECRTRRGEWVGCPAVLLRAAAPWRLAGIVERAYNVARRG